MTRIEPWSDSYTDQIIQLVFKIAEEFDFSLSPADLPDLMEIPVFYQTGSGNFWIALDGQQVIGTMALTDMSNNQGAVKKVFVDKDYRGKGISDSLLDTLMLWCRHKGIDELYLGTRAVFLAAHRFYEKNGFQKIARETLPKTYPLNEVDSRFYRYLLKSDDFPN